MANVARPQGARPKGMPLRENEYLSGGAVYPGDFVKLDATGRVVVAAAGDALLGVSNSYASAAALKMNVWDDPEQLFIVQSDTASAAAQADIGDNANILASSPDSTYKVSRHKLDSSTIATGNAARQLKILGAEARPNEAFGGGYQDYIVALNNHVLKGGTGTAGI